MSKCSQSIIDGFIKRCEDAIDYIKDANIKYIKLGIFGSFARDDFKAGSDIDFVMIIDKEPDRQVLADLRHNLDELGCDIALLSLDNFDYPKNQFHREVKRDFREVLINE